MQQEAQRLIAQDITQTVLSIMARTPGMTFAEAWQRAQGRNPELFKEFQPVPIPKLPSVRKAVPQTKPSGPIEGLPLNAAASTHSKGLTLVHGVDCGMVCRIPGL